MATGRYQFPPLPGQLPPEVTRVKGCDCGGVIMHREDCSIFSLPADAQLAAVYAAQVRIAKYTNGINDHLHCALYSRPPHAGMPDTTVVGSTPGYEASGTPVNSLPHTFGAGETFQVGSAWNLDDGSPEDPEIAAIVRECCQRFRPDLVGPLAGATFTVTSGMTGRRYRVTVTEDQP